MKSFASSNTDVLTEAPNSVHHKRICSIFSGQWPDRIPICEQAFASSVASRILGREAYTGSTDLHFLEAKAWLAGESAHDEFVHKVYEDTIALHRYFDFDILFLPWRDSTRPAKALDEWNILYGDPEKGNWHICRFDPQTRTYGIVESSSSSPERTAESVIAEMKRAIKSYERRLASGDKSSRPKVLNPFLEKAQREYGKEFVVAGNDFFAVTLDPPTLEAVALEPGLVGDWIEIGLDERIAQLKAQRKAGIYLINGGGDFAFNTGPIYSPRFFKEQVAPRWKKIFDKCRELGTYYIMRSDGNLWPVADALFGWARPHAYYECDFDAGMHFDKLRERFPDLVLIGNVSCDLLRRGTPALVRERAAECIQSAAPRMIAASANSILHGTPPENVHALYEAAKSFALQPAKAQT